MTDFQDRMRQAVERSGKSPRAISLEAELSAGTVSELLKNEARSPSVSNLKALAQVLGTSFRWLTEGTLDNAPTPGMSENDATPWLPPPPSGERPDITIDARTLARMIAPRARQPELFRIKTAASLFGLLSGDVVVIDMNRRPDDGDIVLATVADLNTGEAHTVLRKLATPYLISADPADRSRPIVVDGNRTVVMGPIVASLRAPDISQ